MSAIISAIIFLLFSGAVANPFSQPPGKEFIPGIGEGSPRTCIPADASQGTPVLFGIPKPGKDNVPFVDQPNSFSSCSGKGKGCDISPWDGKPIPEIADYVTVAQNVVITRVWPDNDTTRLAKQILPKPGENYYQESFDKDDFRDRIYRPTCNDWCYFVPPRRSPALPYGGTFFCDFIFFYQGQSVGAGIGERKYSPKDGEKYPDDTSCDADTLQNCPTFDVLIRKGAAVPEVAGGGAPGSEVTPLRCDLINATPTPQALKTESSGNVFLRGKKYLPELSKIWPETVQAQTESFINLTGNHDAQGEWIYNTEKLTYAGKMLDPDGGREKIPEPPPIIFRGKEYEAYFNLIKSLRLNKNILYLVETGVVDKADAERAANNPGFEFQYLEFRRSTDKSIPKGKSLQLGTFPVETGRGWWELFPEESKPAIYLYPQKPINLNVKLETKGKLTVSDPPYDPGQGWNITAYPDGSLREYKSNRSYPYLYYEAVLDRVRVEPTGFLVPGAKLRDWFFSNLPKFGLNRRETADFIDYWMGRLDESQPYYFIHFLSEEQIENLEPIKITKPSPNSTDSPTSRTSNPQPQTSIRIRTYFKPLSAEEASRLKINPQTLPSSPPARRGFTLVEWGGILVK